MTRTLRTPATPRAGGEPVDGLEGRLVISPAEIGERLWRIFTSMRTALVLILCLTFIAFVGTLLMQVPSPELQRDPQAYAAWLESLRPKYGGWTGVFDKLQLLSIFSSVWFKGTMVLLTTSILICSVNRFRGLQKTALRPRTKMAMPFYERAPHSASVEADVAPEVALAGLTRAFRNRHYRTVVENDDEATHVYADRFRWAPFGTLMAHLSIVLILAAAIAGQALGFRNSSFAAPIGTKVDVGHDTGLAIEAKSFSDTYSTQNGAPTDYASDLVLYKGEVAVAQQTVRVNQPMEYDGITIYQSFYGPEAEMKVADASGKTVFEGGVPLQWGSTDKNKRIGQFSLPDAKLNVFVVGVASGETDAEIKPGQMQLEVYPIGSDGRTIPTPVATEIVTQGQPAQMAGLAFTFARERQFTGLIVARDPGTFLVWIGMTLLVVGSSLVFLFQNRRIWALIRRTPGGSEVRIGATSRHDATFGPDFQRLVEEIKLALTGSSAA